MSVFKSGDPTPVTVGNVEAIIASLGSGSVPPMFGRAEMQSIQAGTRAFYPAYGMANANTASAVNGVTGRCSFTMFLPNFANGVARRVTAAISLQVTGAGTAGSVYRLGVYDTDPTNPIRPRNLLFDSGAIDGTIVQVAIVPMAILLEQGKVYWLAYKADVALPTVRSFAVSGGLGFIPTLGFEASGHIPQIGLIDDTMGGAGLAAVAKPSAYTAASNNTQNANIMIEFA